MRLRPFILTAALAVLVPAVAQAQDFGIMESAETINVGNFKLRGNPMFIFGKNIERNNGVAIAAGYGFTPRFDAEGNLAFYDGITLFGGNAEYWPVKGRAVDVSVTGGLHGRSGDRTPDMFGIDLTFLASKNVARNLDLYAGLDMAFEKIKDGDRFKTVHLVPGFEYKLAPDVDLVAELGLGLNDNARHYFAVGIAYYIR